ncbi:MAG: type II toxin-antitoxin system RelE/ParE family toxin [Clostridiales bacterium]|jgi:plasmid stabilization system protein ParE|nr:type II toxin-antitoxin system RelE/ParE family toxin [Clostridiales bacterium]
MYQLEYLPIARQDMIEIAKYISHELCNPTAAEKLSNDMIEAIDLLTEYPYSNAVYTTIRPLKREYRKLIVKSYIVFYSIDEKEEKITISRVIYARRDYDKLL